MSEKKVLENLYTVMLQIRMVEEAIAKRYPEYEMRCPTHLCIGQEAIPAGVITHLKPEDIVLSYHRSHGHYLAKGGSLKGLIAELYGKSTGCAGGRGGSQHLIDLSVNFFGATPIVGGTIPIAVGTAWASLLKKKQIITAVFFGDAAVEEGVFHESLNFASLKKLPILFVCENNFYSIFTKISERQPKREIFALAHAHGIFAKQGDGNDAVKVYNLTAEALRQIRNNHGPAFLEFLTYRIKEHCGPNEEPAFGRPKKEINYWLKRCPLVKLEKDLIAKGYITRKQIKLVKQKIAKEIADAFLFAKKSLYPKSNTLTKFVYA